MQAFLKFKFPEDEELFKLCIHAKDFYFILNNLDEWLRKLQKYDEKETLTIEEIRNKIYELLNEYDVNLNMLS